MLPTLRQLEYVVAVADTGQFVEAAAQCAVSQPSLSRQVREVEEQLGVEIFERTRPRVLVTPIGEEVVRRARKLLADGRELLEVASASAHARRGTVRLGVIPTIAPYGLPGVLAKLRQLHPDVTVAIAELQTDVLLEQLRSGAVDVALLAHAFDGQGLAGVDLVVEPFVLVAPCDHPLGVRSRVGTEDVVGVDLLLMEDGHCLRDQAIEVCAAAGPPRSTSVTAASISTLTRMVESGLGATLLPASALAPEVRPDQGIVVRSFGPEPPGRTLTLQWRATSPQGPWFEEIGGLLRAHYLELNAAMPKVCGPKPKIRPAAVVRTSAGQRGDQTASSLPVGSRK